MLTTPIIIHTTTKLGHYKIIFHCLSLIEKPEFNDGAGDVYTILQFNKIDTILDIVCLDDENMKEIYKIVSDKKLRLHFTMSQRNSLKFIQDYNTKQCRNHVFPHWNNGY